MVAQVVGIGAVGNQGDVQVRSGAVQGGVEVGLAEVAAVAGVGLIVGIVLFAGGDFDQSQVEIDRQLPGVAEFAAGQGRGIAQRRGRGVSAQGQPGGDRDERGIDAAAVSRQHRGASVSDTEHVQQPIQAGVRGQGRGGAAGEDRSASGLRNGGWRGHDAGIVRG